MILSLFRRKAPDPSEALYDAIVAAARQPALYLDAGVPDSVEGRFEMLVLHMALAVDRLAADARSGEEETKGPSPLAQALVDRFFLELDRSLREMGIGDVAIPKRMKKLAAAYNGRLQAYTAALDAGDRAGLEAALGRNVFPGAVPPPSGVPVLATYAVAARACLAATSLQHMEAGKLPWPNPARPDPAYPDPARAVPA